MFVDFSCEELDIVDIEFNFAFHPVFLEKLVISELVILLDFFDGVLVEGLVGEVAEDVCCEAVPDHCRAGWRASFFVF